MKKGVVTVLGIATIFLAAGYSSQDSKESRAKPSVNFYGVLKDTSGSTYKVKNITIGRMYSHIPFYAIPSDKKANPSDHTTLIDLSEEYQIRQSVPFDASVSEFNNRDYVKIEIITKDKKKTKHKYLVEKGRRIFCEEDNESGAKEKELTFRALDTLTIHGYEKREDKEKATSLNLTTTALIIDELEDLSKKLPEKDKGIKNKILNLISDLRHSIRSVFS